jgi:ABC-type molybdenum transport system ATPase subunit/photorepair protein PhrA
MRLVSTPQCWRDLQQALAMRKTPIFSFALSSSRSLHTSRRLCSNPAPIVKIQHGTFYRQHPSSKSPTSSGQDANSNPPLFPDLTFSLPSNSTPKEHWAILSPSSTIRTAFLQILRGQYICVPPTARTFPYLLSKDVEQHKSNLRYPEHAIEYVGFDVGRKALGGAYLSARYESLKEATDFTLTQYLTGIMSMNPGEAELQEKAIDAEIMRKVMYDLELERFLHKPVAMLSNGQSRRARIGKALLGQPLVLCLDAPFIGLDPVVTKHISELLHRLAEANKPRIVLSLRPQDTIPGWITHVVYAGADGKVDALGTKKEVFGYLKKQYESIKRSAGGKEMDAKLLELEGVGRHLTDGGNFAVDESSSHTPASDTETLSRDGFPPIDPSQTPLGEPVVEMNGVRIAYGPDSVLGDWHQDVNGKSLPGLHFTISRGSRWGIFGANGSGKTTLLSLVTSDHPQTYSAPVKLFQRSRLPKPGVRGITIFEIQARMGHASPELHALFPKYLSVRSALASAWSDTPITKPKMDNGAYEKVDAALEWFADEIRPSSKGDAGLQWATNTLFGEVSYSAQRVLIFLRATIRNPDIVILDEAFSGMDDLARDKCLLFLSRGQRMELSYTDAGPRPVPREGAVVIPGLQEHQALLCVSHSRQEVPGCIRDWIYLPESGTGPPRFGKWDGPVELDRQRWSDIWDLA